MNTGPDPKPYVPSDEELLDMLFEKYEADDAKFEEMWNKLGDAK